MKIRITKKESPQKNFWQVHLGKSLDEMLKTEGIFHPIGRGRNANDLVVVSKRPYEDKTFALFVSEGRFEPFVKSAWSGETFEKTNVTITIK